MDRPLEDRNQLNLLAKPLEDHSKINKLKEQPLAEQPLVQPLRYHSSAI